ncbi:LOW QUALITY PROTEIN: hypothetical protein KUTeg_024431, partial [Tegillarca granosa]
MDSMQYWVAVLVSTYFALCTVFGREEASPNIYYLHIKSDIKYRFATTLVTSKVVNPDIVSREVIFDVTLPNEAFMSNFTLEINNTLHIGEVKEKEAAKRQYERAKNRGQSAGYIGTKPRETNKFNIKVNVEANASVVFNLTYKEILRRKKGKYSHVIYIDPGQTVEDFQIEVAIQESRDITILHVPPIRNDLLTNVIISESGTNNLLTRPTARSAYILYRLSVQEQSRSSEAGISGQFVVEYDVNREKDAGDLLEGDRFNIMTFDGSIGYFIEGELIDVNVENINNAKQFVKNIRADGSTDINTSMTEGIKLLSSQSSRERARVLIFLTDGDPTTGETNTERILQNIRRNNEIEIPVFSLAFGSGADYSFTKKMAAQNNGFGRKIYEDSDAALQITGFYDEISTVLLKDISFTYLDHEVQKDTLTNIKFNIFFKGSEIIVAGRLSNSGRQRITSLILVDDKNGHLNLTTPNEINSNTGFDLIRDDDFEKITEQVWAYLTIKQKLKQRDASTSENEQETLKQKILDINTAFSLRQRQQRFRIPMFGLSANYYDPPRHFGFMPMYNSFPKYFHPINVPMRKLPPISPTTITKKPFRRTTAMTTPRTTTMTTQRTTTMTTLRTTTMTTPRTTTIGTRPPKRQRRDIFVYGHIGPKRSGSKRNKRRRKQATYFDSISVTSPTHALNFHIDSYLIDGTRYFAGLKGKVIKRKTRKGKIIGKIKIRHLL